MQQITIAGWLSKDSEQSTTQNGQSVTRWNIPVKQGWGEREQTNWYRVSIWGKRADFAAKAAKGDFAIITGELTIGEYNGRPQYEISASDFQSVKMGPREENRPGGSSPDYGYQKQADPVRQHFPQAEDLSDEVPF